MNFFKKYATLLTLVLAVVIACFPDVFRGIGTSLIDLLVANGKTNNLLIALILLFILFILRECWATKKPPKKSGEES